MKNKKIALSALFAALIFIVISIHIPNGMGGVIHFGDALIFIAATLLPFPYAIAVAAIGAGLFNLVFAPVWLPFTIVIKPIMTLCFTSKSNRILGTKRNIIAPIIGAIINTVLYFGANWILFDNNTAIAALTGLSIQGVGSIVFFFAIAIALDQAKIKSRFFSN
ncbi:MAG: TIGR04002 family protein [Defluviitaleaceae bacterium]|nr:TIGR04002 family protein [Defluviitaleaceae bacterium]